MSDLKIAVGGSDYLAEQTISQFAITNAANALSLSTTSAGTVAGTNITGYIATLTFTTAHGLTFSPSANVPPNYFIKFASATVTGGTGVLTGNTFRILTIPSTTTLTFYTTVSAATFSGASVIPVFYPVFQQALLSGAATNTLASGTTGSFATTGGYPYYGTVQAVNLNLGANCTGLYNSTNDAIPLDASTGVTPSTAPTFRTMLAASANGQLRFGPYDQISAAGTTANSLFSIVL